MNDKPVSGTSFSAGANRATDITRLLPISIFRSFVLVCLVISAGTVPALATPVITEFMASNQSTLRDVDGAYSDWIEIYNPDSSAVTLTGWSLTDNAKKKTKWQFPAGVSLPAGGYLTVFASSKDRTDATRELHTNFSLDADGEYLALIAPDGATVATEFSPVFPRQGRDISYGITQPSAATEAPQYGYFAKATPGKRNGDASSLILLETVSFSRANGPFTGTPTVELTGAGAGEVIRYEVVAPSAKGAAVADPTPASPLYTAPLSVTGSVIIRAGVFAADGSRHGQFTSAHYLKVEASTGERVDTFTTRLPLIVLDDHGLGALEKDDIDHSAWFYRLPPKEGSAGFATTPDFSGPITMSVRGTSSALFPKKSFKFTLLDNLGRETAQPLLGETGFTDWNLIGPWAYDRSYIRNAVVYDLSRRMGHWAPRTQLTEVFFNANGGPLDTSDYAGIYLLTDKIEAGADRIAIDPISASDLDATAITGGYLLKVDSPDTDKYSWTTEHSFPGLNDSVLIVESPKAAKLPEAQRTYIRNYIQQMENALYADQANGWVARNYLNYLDLPSWVDYHLINTFVKNTDGLWRSAYFSKDRGGRLVAGPVWDYDRSLGSADGRDARWDSWELEAATDKGALVDYWRFGWWGILATDPEFMQQWVDRWQTLRRDQFSDAQLAAVAAAYADQIGPEAAARDAMRWPENVSFYGSYAAEVERLQSWLVNRAQWIDRQFIAPPTLSRNADGTVTLTPATGSRLAFTLDGEDPRNFGGKPSATVHFADAPLIIEASSDLRARSYAPDSHSFPGSPWSAEVTASTTTPLAAPPLARLINLSARGAVESGENIVIAGIVVDGDAPKSFLARAIGPTLASQGVNAPLGDPVLRVVRNDGVEVASNAGWGSADDAADLPRIASEIGAFALPAGSRDAALIARLPAGVYSLLVSSAANRAGIGLVELYELGSNGRTANISARSLVRPGEGALFGGFVISGSSPKRILIRAVGPTLAGLGVAHPLGDPVLTVYAGDRVVATNDDWTSGDRATLTTAASATGAFALADGSKDAALVTTLPAGVYSVVVSGKNSDQGVALVEIYDVP